MTDEFDVEITPELEKGVAKMCNLSEGIEKNGFDKGRAEGREEGREEGRAEGLKQGQEDEKIASARRMIADGNLTVADIARFSDLPLQRVEELMQEQPA